MVTLAVTAAALWWNQQKYFMNEYEKTSEHTLPYSYAFNKIRWQLGFATLPEFITIPSGSFEMGSDKGESDEKPVHTVTLIQGFSMSRYEVSFAEYDYYVWSMQRYDKQLKHKQQKQGEAIQEQIVYPFDEGWGRSSRPVINVSWDDAQGYVNWLSKERGQSCRLPAEAEWEYAARAGTTTVYPWGDEASHENANYGKDECCDGLKKGRDQWENTSPVGSFPANGFGLADMHGNVWEWVQDCYVNSYAKTPRDGSAQETDQCGSRVLRGGSWFNVPNYLRSANRSSYLRTIVSMS
jgi:formylglycine-generating enzyme required for sulfatase activity